MKIKLLLLLILTAFVLTACGNNQNAQEQKSSDKTDVKAVKKTDVLKTKEGLEAKLKDLGIIIYPGAEFHKMKQSNSTCDGGRFISYNVPDISSDSKKKVADFYKDIFKKLEAEGWKSRMAATAGFDYWYHKGEENIFFKQMFAGDYKIHTLNFTYCPN